MTARADHRLLLLVQRIERLREERAGLLADERDVFAEAKAVGYCTATLRKAIARRAIAPDDRAEADTLLTVYEDALAGAPVVIPDARPDAAALAQAMLAEQIDGLDDPGQAALVIAHVLALLDLRADITELRGQERDRKKMAKAQGLEAKQLGLAVRWFEKCEKHGEEAMRAGEVVFGLYRSTARNAALRGDRGTGAPVSGDAALAKMFAPPKPGSGVTAAAGRRAAADMAAKAARGEI